MITFFSGFIWWLSHYLPFTLLSLWQFYVLSGREGRAKRWCMFLLSFNMGLYWLATGFGPWARPEDGESMGYGYGYENRKVFWKVVIPLLCLITSYLGSFSSIYFYYLLYSRIHSIGRYLSPRIWFVWFFGSHFYRQQSRFIIRYILSSIPISFLPTQVVLLIIFFVKVSLGFSFGRRLLGLLFSFGASYRWLGKKNKRPAFINPW